MTTEGQGTTPVPPPSLGVKAAFGVGSASESIFYIAFNLFCFFYFVQVLGLPGNLAGIAAAVALVFDALSDPIVGYLSDRWKPGRLGRRHPFMFAAALPLGLAWTALFTPPDGLGTWGLFFWLLGFSVLARVCQTVFFVPHIALGGELSGDYTGRTRIFAWHIIFLWAGGAAVHFFGLRYFFASEVNAEGVTVNGMLIAENYPVYGLVWACIMMAVILISTIFTMSRIPYLNRDRSSDIAPPDGAGPAGQTFGRYSEQIWAEFKEVLGNRNYRLVVLALLIQALGGGVHETIISHMINYVWQLTPEEFSLLAFSSMVGYILGFSTAARLHRRFGKREVLVGTAAVMGIAHAMPVGLLFWQLVPIEPGTAGSLWLVLFASALYYSGQSLFLVTLVSAIGDIADEHELQTGRRREGTLYSSRTLFSKMSASLGHLIAGIMLTVIAFPLGKDVLPGTVSQAALDQLAGGYLLLVPLPYLVATLIYTRYAIDSGRHVEILRALADRNRQSAALAAEA